MSGSRRFAEQKWLLDGLIESIGLDWDLPRRTATLGATGFDAARDYAAVESAVTRFDEIGPKFADMAGRRRSRAEAAEAAGDLVTARESYFVAAAFYGWAHWPIHEEGSRDNERWNRAKVECYSHYAQFAAHRVERVEMTMDGRVLPGWLHLPRGTGPHPVVIGLPGMDSFKELQVAMYGDKFLERGIAVLAVEGPGQSEPLVGGLKVTPDNFADAGAVWLDRIVEHPELDETRVGVFGRSFGSYAATVIANAHADRLRGVATAFILHEPGFQSLMREGSPTFKARMMFMTGHEDETAFDEYVRQFVLKDRASGVTCPFLGVAGELDELSPIEHSYDLMRVIPPPAELVVYEAERHAIGRSEAAFNGPHWYPMLADWLTRRVCGEASPTGRRFTYVTRAGERVDRSDELS